MKKICLFSLMVCLFGVSGYAEKCQQSIVFKAGNNNWNAGANEYLFKTKSEYLKAANEGYMYECDNSDCPNNSYIQLPARHVFKGRTIEVSKTYKCVIEGGGDYWTEVSSTAGLTKCSEKKKRSAAGWFNAEANEYLFPTLDDYKNIKQTNFADVYECDSSVCTDGTIITLPANHVFQRNTINKQRRYKCILTDFDDRWIDITDDCDDCDKKKKDCPKGTHKDGKGNCVPDKVNSCKQSRSTEEGKACCGFRKEIADWNGQHCVCADSNKEFKKDANGKWGCMAKIQESCETKYAGNQDRINCCNAENRGEAVWIAALNRCECQNADLKWDIKTGKCVEQSNGGEVAECVFTGNVNIMCNDGKYYKRTETIKTSKNNTECEVWKKAMESKLGITLSEGAFTQIDELDALIQKVCGGNTVVTPGQTIDVEAAKNTVSRFFARAKEDASVWKTSEGNFNGSRLASDLTAGVVLGTVGGVVSANIIKKNQIKKGYEVLHCTIGGQNVADWGDTFSAGLR